MKKSAARRITVMALAILILVSVSLAALTSCNNSHIGFSKSLYVYFNTRTEIECHTLDTREQFDAVVDLVSEELERYHKYFDIYNEYSKINNLRTINLAAGKNAVKVEGEIIDFLLYAKDMYYLTGGEMNIAMGSVLKLWHDAREAEVKYVPSYDELLFASEHTDIEKIVINEAESTVYLADPDMLLDAGALAKGYATERIAEKLMKEGMADGYVLNVGGNIRLIGKKNGNSDWTVGIVNPDKASSEEYVSTISVSDISVVTSGDYERYMTVGDKNYHHIIDKDTLMPSEYFSSVSVVTKDGGLADALTTALFCMSYEDGLALVSTLQGVEVLWIRPNGEQLMTDGYREIVKK